MRAEHRYHADLPPDQDVGHALEGRGRGDRHRVGRHHIPYLIVTHRVLLRSGTVNSALDCHDSAEEVRCGRGAYPRPAWRTARRPRAFDSPGGRSGEARTTVNGQAVIPGNGMLAAACSSTSCRSSGHRRFLASAICAWVRNAASSRATRSLCAAASQATRRAAARSTSAVPPRGVRGPAGPVRWPPRGGTGRQIPRPGAGHSRAAPPRTVRPVPNRAEDRRCRSCHPPPDPAGQRLQQRFERLRGLAGGAGGWPRPSARLPSRLGSCCRPESS